MKKTILAILLLMTLLLGAAACGKGGEKDKATQPTEDPNAVLTDSNVPLDLGAEWDDELTTEAE